MPASSVLQLSQKSRDVHERTRKRLALQNEMTFMSGHVSVKETSTQKIYQRVSLENKEKTESIERSFKPEFIEKRKQAETLETLDQAPETDAGLLLHNDT